MIAKRAAVFALTAVLSAGAVSWAADQECGGAVSDFASEAMKVMAPERAQNDAVLKELAVDNPVIFNPAFNKVLDEVLKGFGGNLEGFVAGRAKYSEEQYKLLAENLWLKLRGLYLVGPKDLEADSTTHALSDRVQKAGVDLKTYSQAAKTIDRYDADPELHKQAVELLAGTIGDYAEIVLLRKQSAKPDGQKLKSLWEKFQERRWQFSPNYWKTTLTLGALSVFPGLPMAGDASLTSWLMGAGLVAGAPTLVVGGQNAIAAAKASIAHYKEKRKAKREKKSAAQ